MQTLGQKNRRTMKQRHQHTTNILILTFPSCPCLCPSLADGLKKSARPWHCSVHQFIAPDWNICRKEKNKWTHCMRNYGKKRGLKKKLNAIVCTNYLNMNKLGSSARSQWQSFSNYTLPITILLSFPLGFDLWYLCNSNTMVTNCYPFSDSVSDLLYVKALTGFEEE